MSELSCFTVGDLVILSETVITVVTGYSKVGCNIQYSLGEFSRRANSDKTGLTHPKLTTLVDKVPAGCVRRASAVDLGYN